VLQAIANQVKLGSPNMKLPLVDLMLFKYAVMTALTGSMGR
jgi:hypothetical protein